MKKNSSVLFLALMLAIQSFLWVSCDVDENVNQTEASYDFLIQSNQEEFPIKSDADLAEFIKYKAVHENITVETVTFEEATDEESVFQVIKATYRLEDNRITHLTIPLNLVSQQSPTQTFVSDCIMTCTPKANCDKSEQVITKKCGGQLCGCATEGGSSVGSVKFED